MIPLKLINTLIIVLLIPFIAVYSQPDSGTAFKVNDISIDYSAGLMKIMSYGTGKTIMVPNSRKIEDIYSVIMIGDSVISVSNKTEKNVLLNINNIEQITVKNGAGVANILGGAGLGYLFGLGVGALIYESTKEEKEPAPQG